jgi:hypothetical protein
MAGRYGETAPTVEGLMSGGWVVWIAVIVAMALLVALVDRRSRRRRVGTKRAPGDRPGHEQPSPGGGFQANQQSGKFGPWA